MSQTKRALEKVWEELGTQPEIRFGTYSEPACPECKGIGFVSSKDKTTSSGYELCGCRKIIGL